MAFIEVSPTNKYAVRSIDKTVHEKERIDSACTHHPYNSDVGRILEPCNPRCIGCGIAAPMAQEAKNLRLKGIIYHFIYFN